VLRLLHKNLPLQKMWRLLEEYSAVVNLVPQTRHVPSGLEVRFAEVWRQVARFLL
jgi:hypothetical protein